MKVEAAKVPRPTPTKKAKPRVIGARAQSMVEGDEDSNEATQSDEPSKMPPKKQKRTRGKISPHCAQPSSHEGFAIPQEEINSEE